MATSSDTEAGPGSSPLSSLASDLVVDSHPAPPHDHTTGDSIRVNTDNPKSPGDSTSNMKTIADNENPSGGHKKREFSKAFQRITTAASAASKKAKKATIDRRWQPDYVLSDDKSPLGSADLRVRLPMPLLFAMYWNLISLSLSSSPSPLWSREVSTT